MSNQLKSKRFNEKITTQAFHEVLSESFKRYAKYIIQDRALPDIRDGLKPVQRRILYAMVGLGLKSTGTYKKSARTVGEVIGKYHPHGDSSIYEALVRMGQEWKNNLVLVDMQGNKGSIDGDPPAAMRYTEAKLSLFAERLLTNLEKKTVKFVRNFDDSEMEPTVLPALVPNLLINGASGIASGYATNIPPHNPVEVMNAAIFRLENPTCSLSQLNHIVKGPDFPTGGIIQGSDGIRSIYKTGQGKVNIVSQISYDPIENALVVKSIPFETNKSSILKSIDDIIVNNQISGIADVVDSSDKNGVNIVVKLEKSMSGQFENIKNYLLKNTALQISYSANMVAIVGGKPVQFGLVQYLDAFINHALDVVVKTAQYDLTNSEQRLEIVSGMIRATSMINTIIKIVRTAADRAAAQAQIEKLGFSKLQAEAILRLRLYNLTNADANELMHEEVQLKTTIAKLKKIVNNQTARVDFLRKKMIALRDEFAFKRRSKIEAEITKINVNHERLVQQKNVYVTVSRDGYIKATTANFAIDEETYLKSGLKEKDLLVSCVDTSNSSTVILVTSKGNFLNIPVYKIKELKWRELGAHLNYLTPLSVNEKIIDMFVVDKCPQNSFITLVSRCGLIKRVLLDDLTKMKIIKTSVLMRFKSDDDELVGATISNDESDFVYLFTQTGRALKYEVGLISTFGPKASGVKALHLNKSDAVVAGFTSKQSTNEQICLVSTSGAKRVRFDDVANSTRNTVGKSLFSKSLTVPNYIIAVGVVKPSSQLNVVYENGDNGMILASSIPIGANSSRLSYWNAKVLKVKIVNFTQKLGTLFDESLRE